MIMFIYIGGYQSNIDRPAGDMRHNLCSCLPLLKCHMDLFLSEGVGGGKKNNHRIALPPSSFQTSIVLDTDCTFVSNCSVECGKESLAQKAC